MDPQQWDYVLQKDLFNLALMHRASFVWKQTSCSAARLELQTVSGNVASAAYFWVISLLFRAAVKTGSITWELPESHRAAINHRRGDVLCKQSTEGERTELATELQKVKTKPAYKTAEEQTGRWKQ